MMAKTHCQQQKDYIQKRKGNDPEYNRKEAERKKNKRREVKLSAAKYEAAKAKDRARKRNKTIITADSSTTLETSFTSRQSFGKATAKVIRSLPKQPGKTKEVIGQLLRTLSPRSKKDVFTSARRRTTDNRGRPHIPDETIEAILAFLERPDISYCSPEKGRYGLLWKR